MNELTQERSRTNAGIVKSALTSRQIARNTNELIQERSLIHASILINAFAGHQLASQRNVKETMK